MTETSSQHAYVTWTKHRLDEMDAALASIETTASQLATDAKAKAAQLNADLIKRRGDFEAEVKAHLKAGETNWEASKTKLEKDWTSFEAELKAYVETVGEDIEQKRTMFADIAAAQAKAWGETVDKLQSAGAELGAESKAKLDEVIEHLRVQSTEAKAHLGEFRQAGNESWAALSAALQTSRKKFDDASHSAGEALKTALTTKKS